MSTRSYPTNYKRKTNGTGKLQLRSLEGENIGIPTSIDTSLEFQKHQNYKD